MFTILLIAKINKNPRLRRCKVSILKRQNDNIYLKYEHINFHYIYFNENNFFKCEEGGSISTKTKIGWYFFFVYIYTEQKIKFKFQPSFKGNLFVNESNTIIISLSRCTSRVEFKRERKKKSGKISINIFFIPFRNFW